jgi:hypothetical protein
LLCGDLGAGESFWVCVESLCLAAHELSKKS